MTASGGWQTGVNTVPAPGVVGDFCDTNPRYSVDAGPGGFVAGSQGVVVGLFAWASYQGIDPNNAPTILNNFSIAGVAPTGFVAREQQGLITTYLTPNGLTIPQGFPVTAFSGGGFWVKNDGTTAALVGQKCFAQFGTGKAEFHATGSTGSASFTGSIAAGASGNFTGSVFGNTLTVTVAPATPLVVGAVVAGTVGGSGVVAGSQIVAQLSGTIGGVGTYALNIPEQFVTSGTLTASWGVLTVSAVSSGAIALGEVVSGTGVTTAGTAVTALGTGTGQTGTYIVNNTQTVVSGAMTTGTIVETRFTATSSGQPGELIKISDRPSAG